MKRFHLLYVVPALAILVTAVLPLVLGRGTLYHRDLLINHYPMKVAQAEALRHGELPLVDVYRGGGQPLLGNLNTVALYPDNLLYLAAPPLWALNAHFWLHLFLAPFCFLWLGRAWGLSRPAAWAGGVCYAASGFFLSLFNLYNLVAGATLAPAFIAACLEAATPERRRRHLLWVGLLWALLLLAGDPTFAGLALVLALGAVFARHGRRIAEPLRGLAALACGTLLAAPQIVELLRILPLSFRGHWRYSAQAALAQSWDPRSALEWLVPLVFGPPDFSFWGTRFYGGNPPLLYSLYPGLLLLALVLLAGRPRTPAAGWGWAAILGGAFFALGWWNPLMRLVYDLPGGSLLRYPVKLWLAVMLGAALLAGLGFERFLAGESRRLITLLAGGMVFFLTAWGLLTFAPGWMEGLQGLDPRRLSGAFFAAERERWAALCLTSALLLLLLALAWLLGRRHRELGGALLLLVHLAGQCHFLAPLYEADDVEPYRQPPELLAAVPADALVVHGGLHDLFGTAHGDARALFPDPRTFWLMRSFFAQLYPFSGIAWGRRYEFNHSPEGLDSFFNISLSRALTTLPDAARLRILAAQGVDVLLLDRPLAAEALDLVRLRASAPAAGLTVHVYELLRPARPVELAGTVLYAPHMNAALQALTAPAFDPRAMAVLPGTGPALARPAGTAEVVEETRERLVVQATSPEGGVLVVRRAYLPTYRATLDGSPVPLRVANVQRLAVEVPPGEHRVELWVDRRPLTVACVVAMLAAVGLALLALRPRRENAG